MKRLIVIISGLALVLSCGKTAPGTSTEEPLAMPDGIVPYGQTTETSLGFKWNPVEGASSYQYRLLIGEREVESKTITNRFIKLEGLVKATTYRFSVCAVSGERKSAWSSFVEARTEGESGASVEMPDPLSGDVYAQFLIPAAEEELGALAFPGAEGGGMYTTGGRGGKVYHVTTLEDDKNSPKVGSLRYAIEKESRPLVIVFDVAGIIPLQAPLKEAEGDLTIAGQTAPGGGICLKNYTVNLQADNVIIRFVHFRLGDEGPSAGDGEDCIWGRYLKHIILDHCSMSWSIDECASFYGNVNMTMQWCVIAESMLSSVHSKGEHGYGGIWGGKNASFHHNLLAHHQNRTPRFDHQNLYDDNNKSTQEYRGNVDYRNCVNYNWGSSNGCYGGEGGHYNLVNNYYKKGPDSNDKRYFIEADGGYSKTVKENDVEVKKYFPYDWAYLYLSGNYNNEYPTGSSSYPDGVYWKKAYSDYNLSYEGHLLSTPLPLVGKDGKDVYTTTHTAPQAMQQVCAWAGASLVRDAVDQRICEDVKKGSGRLIKNMDDVKSAYGSTWPEYKGDALKDSDADGIPDYYESLFSLNLNDPSDAAAKTLDPKGRYTNLEMYLHYLVKDIVAAQNADGTYQKL